MSEQREERCETCRFWDDAGEGSAYCRRYAPQARVVKRREDQTGDYPLWPETLHDEWCGEWQAKELKQVTP